MIRNVLCLSLVVFLSACVVDSYPHRPYTDSYMDGRNVVGYDRRGWPIYARSVPSTQVDDLGDRAQKFKDESKKLLQDFLDDSLCPSGVKADSLTYRRRASATDKDGHLRYKMDAQGERKEECDLQD